MGNSHHVQWIDGRKEPQCRPNPAYPKGIDLDASAGASLTCTVVLPYPAKRIGHFEIFCPVCGARSICTTAGRPDDPRSLKIACRSMQDVAMQ